MEHRRLTDCTIDQVGHLSAHVPADRDIHLRGARCLVGQWFVHAAMHRLASDHQHLGYAQHRTRRANRVFELCARHEASCVVATRSRHASPNRR